MQISGRRIAATVVTGIFYLSLAGAPAWAAGSPLGDLGVPIGSTGTGVSCSRAVKEILPKGWRLELPGAPAMCRSVSWRAGDSALEVYERIGAQSGLAVVADVGSRIVMLGTRASIAGEHDTHAPRLSGPHAFVDTSVRAPLKAIATHYKLRLQCASACDRSLPGPVTLMLGGDIGEDARLLERSLGPLEPLRITEDPVTRVLDVRPASQASFAVDFPRPRKPWWRRWF
jgi:hypothetical protein